MSAKPLFVLTASIDEGILYWHPFRADNEEQIARHILANAWKQQGPFRDPRLGLRELDHLTPADVPRAIHGSQVDGSSRIGFRLLRIEPKDITELEVTGA